MALIMLRPLALTRRSGDLALPAPCTLLALHSTSGVPGFPFRLPCRLLPCLRQPCCANSTRPSARRVMYTDGYESSAPGVPPQR